MFLVFIPGCLHKLYWLQYLICFLSNGDFTRRCLKLNSVKIPHHSPLSKLTRALSHTHTHNQAHKKPAFCRINFSATFLSPSSHTTPPLIHPFHWFCQATKKHRWSMALSYSIFLPSHTPSNTITLLLTLQGMCNAFMNGARFVVIFIYILPLFTLFTPRAEA